jgi:hypothetical protein
MMPRSWFTGILILMTLFCGNASAAEDAVGDILRSQKPRWYDSARDDWRRIAANAPAAKPTSTNDVNANTIGSLFAYVMIAVVAAATLLLIYRLFLNLKIDSSLPLAAERRAAVARAVADLSALPFSEDDVNDPEAALRLARSQGDWRKAIAWSYALHLVELDQAGVLKLTKGTTNLGYLRIVRAWASSSAQRAAVPKLLADAITTFERTWFGHHAVDETVLQTLELGREHFNSLCHSSAKRQGDGSL